MQAHCPFHRNGNVHFTSGSPIPPLPFAQEKVARHVGASLKSQHLLPWWLISSEDNLVLIMAGLSPISHDFSFLPVTLFPRLPRRFSHITWLPQSSIRPSFFFLHTLALFILMSELLWVIWKGPSHIYTSLSINFSSPLKNVCSRIFCVKHSSA